MATGRTISASFLTELDNKVINLCNSISELIFNTINNDDLKKDFKKQYGKISLTRDSGLGLAGGKLQRDAICTRGRQGKAPFSNRNLRWHPLIVAENPVEYAKEIERIEIEGEDEEQLLIFVVNINGEEQKYPSDKVHELPERFVALPKHWYEHIDKLKHWNDTLWTQNSCVIPAYEACDWQDSVKTQAVLAIAVAVEYYKVDYNNIYLKIKEILNKQDIDDNISLPTELFPDNKKEITTCPVCKLPLSDDLQRFRTENRIPTWQPTWRHSKKKEGNDGSNQILHVTPLAEDRIKHKANTVRYGHRWCNVAMTDHSLDETIDFMEFVVKAHNRI